MLSAPLNTKPDGSGADTLASANLSESQRENLTQLRKKRDFLLKEEAKFSGGTKKFKIMVDIEDCEKKIREIEEGQRRKAAPDGGER